MHILEKIIVPQRQTKGHNQHLLREIADWLGNTSRKL